MPDPTLIDFDAFWTEEREETMPVRFEGHEYQVPASPPAGAVLFVARLAKDGDVEVGRDDLTAVASGILGKANLEAILGRNPELRLLKLLAFITMVSNRQTAAVTPPNRAARRAAKPKRRNRSTSSSRGPSSRPTSSASTDSTFAPV